MTFLESEHGAQFTRHGQAIKMITHGMLLKRSISSKFKHLKKPSPSIKLKS